MVSLLSGGVCLFVAFFFVVCLMMAVMAISSAQPFENYRSPWDSKLMKL